MPMKRFVETSRFDDPWFSDLPPEMKCAWDYIWSKCDAAGVWIPNAKLGDFQIGKKVNWEDFAKRCAHRVSILPNGNWFLVEFVAFQCGELSESCRPHQAVIAKMRAHGLMASDSLSVVFPKTTVTLLEQDKEQDQEKETEKKGEGCGEREQNSAVFMRAWNELPVPFPKIRSMSDDRKRELSARMKDLDWVSMWREALLRLPTCAFAMGQNDREWIADVDFFLRAGSVSKILEGKYDKPGQMNGTATNHTQDHGKFGI